MGHDKSIQNTVRILVAERGAMLYARDRLDALTNLRISLDGAAIGFEGPVELYAKVINVDETTNNYRIRFTGVSEEISLALGRLVAGMI